MSLERKRLYEFGPYRLDAMKRILVKEGEQVPLTPKAFDTLLALVQSSGDVLRKDDLMKRVWPDSFVEEGNLTVNISMLRKTLGESPDQHRYIVTVPGRGYQFVASVREFLDDGADFIVEEHTRSRLVAIESGAVTDTELLKERTGIFWPIGSTSTHRYRLADPRFWGIALIVMGAASMVSYYLLRPSGPVTGQRRTIAVLPFRLSGAEADDEYLGLGVADTLIAKLSNIGQITVRPTSAIRRYDNIEQDPIVVGRELGAALVLQGTIQRQGGRIRITARLVNTQDRSTLWADKFDQDWTDIFAIQDAISEKIARTLAIRLNSAEEELLAKHYTQNIEAYRLYLKGRYFWDKRSSADLEKSIKCFEEALDKDPGYALAYAGMADSYALLVSGGGEYSAHVADAISKARAAAMQALRQDETLADAHTSLGIIHLNYDWDWANAELEFERALQLNPGSSNAHYWYSLYLSAMDRREEAIAESRLAAEIEPLSPLLAAQVARALIWSHRYDEAIAQSRRALELDPNRAVVRYMLAEAYREQKDYQEAIAEYRKVVPFAEDSPIVAAAIGAVHALAGQRADAEKILGELKKRSQREYVSPYYFVDLYASLGYRDQAFEWIEKAYQEHADFLAYAKVENIFNGLRNDPRYADLLRRLNLDR